MRFENFLLFLCFLTPAAHSSAEEPVKRPIHSRYTFEVGRRHALSTYLSPLVYTGPDFAFEGSWRKVMPFNSRWEMEFRGNLDFSPSKSPARNSTMDLLQAGFSWGMEYVWSLPDTWRIGTGGSVGMVGGALYLNRNGNNPVEALASAGINATLSVRRVCRLGCLRLTPFCNFTLPLAGAFFCPEYGESYYEIYLGNRKGLAHAGWWGNNFGLDNLLGAELHFGRRSLVLGWRYTLSTLHVNNLDTQMWRHAGVVGLAF